MGEVAVIAFDDLQFNAEPAEADKPNDVVEAHRGATRFPACYGGLGSSGTVGEFGLGEAGTSTCLSDQITTVRCHRHTITDLLCTFDEWAESAQRASTVGLFTG